MLNALQLKFCKAFFLKFLLYMCNFTTSKASYVKTA
jgi:hypothetical protein